jgi:hypothetical protein
MRSKLPWAALGAYDSVAMRWFQSCAGEALGSGMGAPVKGSSRGG